MSGWLAVMGLLALAMTHCSAEQIHCDVSHPAVAVALDRLKTVVASPPFADLDYDFGLEAPDTVSSLGAEGFEIRPAITGHRTTLMVRAESPLGLAHGVLRLVRLGLSAPAGLGSTRIRLRPAMPIREVYEEHGWDDPQAMESYRERLRWFLEEGYNRLDLPFGWWMPPPDDLLDPTEFHRQWDPALETTRRVIDYAHDLGFGVYLVENPQFNPYYQTPETAVREPYRRAPRPLAGEAYMLCPSEPANQALARRRAEYLYRQMPKADGIVVYFGDPGGCPCAQCSPWGRTIVRLCRDLYAPLLAGVAPRWKMTVTLWGVPRSDVTHVVGHLDELPSVVQALQIPPTAPVPPYLLYDRPMVREVQRAAPQRDVVMQQFLDGVGFRNGWVNLVEHPMPDMMERNLRASYRGQHLAGVYASAFDCYYQRVGTRLIGEWGINPARSAREILVELGSEWFGPAAGPDFAHAMEAMERYWDVAYDPFFGDGPTENGADARAPAEEVVDALQEVSRHAVRSPARLASFQALAEAMVLTAAQAEARAKAARLEEQGRREEAIGLLGAARRDAARIAHLLSTGPYAYLPGTGFWRDLWVIGKRAATIDQEIAQLRATGPWEPVAVPDGDFRQHSWAIAATGRIEWVEDPRRGTVTRFDNSQAEGQWSATASPPMALDSHAPFRITCDARRSGKGGAFWAQWLNADGAELGSRMMVDVPADGRWHAATLSGLTPTVAPGGMVRLRFVLVWPAKEARLAKLTVCQRASVATVGGDR